MLRRNHALAGVLVGAFAFAGACADVPPTEPLAVEADGANLFRGAPKDPSSFSGGLDAVFVRIAQENPGFGGFFYGEDGALNIYSTGVQPLSTRELGALRAPLGTLGVDLAAQPVNVLQAQYDFIQLNAVHRSVSPVLALRGVVFTDADEARNRVTIGVEDAAAAASVERALGMLGVPRDAVVLEETTPIVTEQSLQSMVRPVAGGLQVNFTRGDPPAGFLCTHGFNVRSPAGPVQGFVTNSHCSDTRGVVLNTPYWQHSRFIEGTFIGNEVWDLPFFQGPPCPPDRNCRFSDALGAVYAPGVPNAFGEIYRTVALGSLEIDPDNPRWQIVDELPFPFVGQVLHKVGRTSGWTTGPVTATCVTSNVAGAGMITMLCQDRVDTPSAGGDSGSPYFERIGETNQVRLIGIHWGSGGTPPTTVFSAMDNIRFENEGPAPWITFPGQTPPSAQ